MSLIGIVQRGWGGWGGPPRAAPANVLCPESVHSRHVVQGRAVLCLSARCFPQGCGWLPLPGSVGRIVAAFPHLP